MSEHLIVTDEDGARIITMRRPEKKNALTQDMYGALAAALAAFGTKEDLRLVDGRELPVDETGDDHHLGRDPATRGGNAPDGRKVKATIHWVSAKDSVPAEIRIYNQLFKSVAPDPAEFAAHIKAEIAKWQKVVGGLKVQID